MHYSSIKIKKVIWVFVFFLGVLLLRVRISAGVEEIPYSGLDLAHKFREIRKAGETHDWTTNQHYINKRGHIRKRVALGTYINFARKVLGKSEYTEEDVKAGKIKAGDIMLKQLIHYWLPTEIRYQGILSWQYVETETFKKENDTWLYLPSFRKVRRLSAGNRQDSVGGGDHTYDDINIRLASDEKWTVIGTDTLPDGKECIVAEAAAVDPTYYLSKRIIWFDKNSPDLLFPREEQYDRKGLLYKIMVYKWDYKKGYPYFPVYDTWNLQLDHRTFMMKEDVDFDTPIVEEYLSPTTLPLERMRKTPNVAKLKHFERAEDFPPKPLLLRDKMPELRKIKLPEEIKEEVLKEIEKK